MGEQVLGERSAVVPVDGAEAGAGDGLAPRPMEASLELQQLARARATASPVTLRDVERAMAEVLRGVGRGPDAERTAHVVLSLLEDKVFDGLTGPTGRPLRAEAVEAVLRLGYPFALELEPLDLQFLRDTQRAERLRPLRRAALALLLAAAAGLGTWAAVRWAVPLGTAPAAQPDETTAVEPGRPNRVSDLVARGKHLYEDGDFEGAVGPLRECVLVAADNFSCRTYLGAVLTELGASTGRPDLSVEGKAHLDRAAQLRQDRGMDPAASNVFWKYRQPVQPWPGAGAGPPAD